jgi:hypothetical protein
MDPIRVLYSFPHRLGDQRIFLTAWQQVEQVSTAGAEVTVLSDATGAPCVDGETGLIHPMRDVSCLSRHLAEMRGNTVLRHEIRARSIELAKNLTWRKAGKVMLDGYRSAIGAVRALS